MQQRALHPAHALEGQAKLQRVLRELPAKATQRNAKQHEEDLIAETRRLDCGAFQGVDTVQEQRLAAFEDAWSLVDEQLKELRQRLLVPVFEQVREFARTYAASTGSSSWSDGLVPTVLLSTGMSADHAHTYPDLMVYLRSQGHSVALISARDVQPTGAGLSGILQSVLRQFMGAATHADDMQALLAWWAEEVERTKALTASTAAGGAGPVAGHASPSQAGAGDRPAGPEAGVQADGQPGEADPGAAGPSNSGRPSRAAQQTRELRPRKTPGGTPHAAPHAVRRALQPPVLIVQEAEGSDMGVMQDLVTLLRQERPGLPVTLVLGFSTNAVLFEQLLPSGIGRRIAQAHVGLPSPRDHLHALWRGVLLRGAPPALVLGPQCAAWVLRQFHEVDASTALLESSMQLAFMEHFQQQPLSVLAPAITSGDRKQLHSALQQLPKPVLQQCHAAVSGGNSAGGRGAAGGAKGVSEAAQREAVEAAVWQAMQAYAKWRLAVLLMHAAALYTGAADGNASLQLPALYAAASSADFHEATRGQPSQAQLLVRQLCSNSGSASVRLQQGEQFDGLLQKLLIVARAAVAAPEPPKQEQGGVIVLDDSDSDTSGSSSSDSDTSSSGDESDSDSGVKQQRPFNAKPAGASGVAPLLQDCQDVLQLLAMLEALERESADAGGSSSDSDAQENQGAQAGRAPDVGLGVTPLAARLKGSANIGTPTAAACAASPDAGAGGSGLGVTPLAARLAQAATVQSPTSRAKENRQRRQQQAKPQEQLQRPSKQGTQNEPAAAKAQAAGITPQLSSSPAGTTKAAAKATPNARTARLMAITARAAQPARAAAPAHALHQAADQTKGAGKASPAVRLAAAMEQRLPELMAEWARCSPGAAAFLFDDAALLQSALSPVPRLALHTTLAHPNVHLPGCASAMGAEWPDACIAYGLLQRHDGDMLPTAEWFGQFASVYGLRPGGQDGAEAEEDEEGGGRAKRGRAGARRGRGGKTKVRPDDAAQVVAAQAGRQQRVAAARAAEIAQVQAASVGAGPSNAATSGAVDKKRLLDTAARFCQAANELRFVGAWRPHKRRKVASVQRTLVPMVVQDVHGPGVAA